jgi:CheY-like chemotaxis protein
MIRESDPILIVDDSETDAELFRSALQEAQVENPLVHVSSYDEAMDYLMARGKYLDRITYPIPLIVFLDINMPGKSGLDVLQWIRENERMKRLVVIMMSGSTSDADISRAYALGANSYLLKPETREDLVKTLVHFRMYWLDLNRYAF